MMFIFFDYEFRIGTFYVKRVYCCCVRDDERVSHKTEDPTGTHQMASVAILIGRALVNALVFTSSSYLFSRLSKDSIDKERIRHNLVIEQVVWEQK